MLQLNSVAALQEITTLGSCGQSAHGKRYRSLICTIVRNDLHLREFIVRHLLLGFCHIVVYDNNQVLRGRDHDITPVVEPFVKQGAVTHIPYLQNVTGGALWVVRRAGAYLLFLYSF